MRLYLSNKRIVIKGPMSTHKKLAEKIAAPFVIIVIVFSIIMKVFVEQIIKMINDESKRKSK